MVNDERFKCYQRGCWNTECRDRFCVMRDVGLTACPVLEVKARHIPPLGFAITERGKLVDERSVS